MKKALSILSIAAASMAASGIAHAQSADTANRWYLGGGLGHVNANPNSSDYADQRAGAQTSTGRDNSTAWKAYGGYQFTSIWGAELGYAHLGQFQNSYSLPAQNGSGVGTDKLSAWSLAGTATWPINQDFALRGKLGLARLRTDYSFSGSGAGSGYVTGDNGSLTKTNLMFGLGAQYNLNRNVALRVDYENFGKVGSPTNNLTSPGATGQAKPSMVSASVQYLF